MRVKVYVNVCQCAGIDSEQNSSGYQGVMKTVRELDLGLKPCVAPTMYWRVCCVEETHFPHYLSITHTNSSCILNQTVEKNHALFFLERVAQLKSVIHYNKQTVLKLTFSFNTPKHTVHTEICLLSLCSRLCLDKPNCVFLKPTKVLFFGKRCFTFLFFTAS